MKVSRGFESHSLSRPIVVAIDFLEWTLNDRLSHVSFVAISPDARAKEIRRGS